MFLPSNITLKFGDSGDFVSELQRRLVAVGCFSSDAINGFFDGSTVNGVSSFQSMSGIRADGIAGPETLRRLNGVISGDNSSTADTKAEEEKRLQQEQALRLQREQQYLYEQQALLEQQRQQQAYAAQMQAQSAAQTYAPQPQAQPQAALPEVNYAQAPVYQPQQPIQPLQSVATAGDDMLARMLLGQQPQAQAQPQVQTQQQQQAQLQQQQSQQQQLAQPQAFQAPQPPQANINAAMPPAQAAMQVLTPSAVAMQPALAPAQPLPMAANAQDPNAQQSPTVEQPPRGMIGRAVQFVSEKIQQLHQYFEAKLPPHALNEARSAGLLLAQSGVKEAAIPGGPEPQRGIEGPQRGQQQVQQRG